MADLELFSDRSLTEQISEIKFERIDVGTETEMTLYLANQTEWSIENIKLEGESDPEFQMIGVPNSLEPNEVIEITLTWTPSLDRRKVLDLGGFIEGDVMIG